MKVFIDSTSSIACKRNNENIHKYDMKNHYIPHSPILRSNAIKQHISTQDIPAHRIWDI